MVCAMVNEGWDFETLMKMEPGELCYWYRAQEELNAARAKEARKGKK